MRPTALLRWSDNDLDQRDFVLCLGCGLTGIVTVDLAVVPHILLGGSTGSGKSILLKLLIMEAIQKGAEVCVADFKGGVDYPAAWQTRCRFCFDEPALLCLLDELADTLQQRKQLFRDSGCADLREYNTAAVQKLPRCVFACDEVAEVLDKTGAAKERREQIGQIETRLATIARQGRAFGLHLILATQRPDARKIPPRHFLWMWYNIYNKSKAMALLCFRLRLKQDTCERGRKYHETSFRNIAAAGVVLEPCGL